MRSNAFFVNPQVASLYSRNFISGYLASILYSFNSARILLMSFVVFTPVEDFGGQATAPLRGAFALRLLYGRGKRTAALDHVSNSVGFTNNLSFSLRQRTGRRQSVADHNTLSENVSCIPILSCINSIKFSRNLIAIICFYRLIQPAVYVRHYRKQIKRILLFNLPLNFRYMSSHISKNSEYPFN